MPQVTVWLTDDTASRLKQLAIRERRRVADQAAVVIETAVADIALPESEAALAAEAISAG